MSSRESERAMSMDATRLKGQYGRLKGIREAVALQSVVPAHVGEDYNKLVNDIAETTGEDCSTYLLAKGFAYAGANGGTWVTSLTIQAKLLQFMSYLDYVFHLASNVIEIGSIYNSINDEELKGRCSDILSSPGNFDRVVNQATLVLEDRIRTRSNVPDLVGVQLVNKAINSDCRRSVLQMSEDPEEHEGIAHICRGIVLSFRNPTHHRITHGYSRQDAIKFCAFVDILLAIVGKSRVNNAA